MNLNRGQYCDGASQLNDEVYSMLNNEITNQLHIKYPIIQAPMAGGVTTSKLVAEVSNAGGLGMIGAGYMSPNQMREQIREIKKLTSNNFGINLFVPSDFNSFRRRNYILLINYCSLLEST